MIIIMSLPKTKVPGDEAQHLISLLFIFINEKWSVSEILRMRKKHSKPIKYL